MSPEDERLVADLDEATSRLRSSLKSCRKILEIYRPELATPPPDEKADPPLFDWPEAQAGDDDPPREAGG